MAYFLGVPRSERLEAVDARLTTRLEKGAVSTSSESRGEDAGQKQSPPGIRESLGKRAVENEPAQKKRKTTDVPLCKTAGISIDGGWTARTQSTVMSEWLDDDEVPVALPPSTKASLCSVRVEVRSKGGEDV